MLDYATESEFRDLIRDVTPPKWLAMSFPSSPTLPGFLIDLQERVDYIRELSTKEDVKKFWLPGFYCKNSFFAMILQSEALSCDVALDDLTFNFKVINNSDEISENGYRIHGLSI